MISVVVPALNEERNLRPAVLNILAAARAAGGIACEVIVVNDGSSDRTGEIADALAREFPVVRVVHHERNLGFGSALLDGIRLARYEKLCLFPGDDAVHPYTMQNVFRNAHRADLVLAYIVNSEARSWGRLVLSSLFTSIYCFTFNIHLKYINGAPAYSVAWLKRLGAIRSRRYSIFAEIHVRLLRQGISYLEIDGYLKPSRKSSALRWKTLLDVVAAYLKLVVEVYVANPGRYSAKPKRVLPNDGIIEDIAG